MQRRRSLRTRGLAALAIAAVASFAMSGCSPGVDYPSIFPAVHDMPPPRTDKPMDADQVQQATETLITERNQLSSEAQTNGLDKGQPPNPAKKPVQAQAPAAAKKPPATAASTQTAGADTKP